MFTGIIESLGEIVSIEDDKTNKHFVIKSTVSDELKVDQSIAHNGVCLTVIEVEDGKHTVTAIKETLDRSNIGELNVGDVVNLERCTKVGDRLDGHIVQGHVDQIGTCTEILDENGSFKYTFVYGSSDVTVEKGSICINGVSLTVVDSAEGSFSVAIIPFTLDHTNFKHIKPGTTVNLEFDIVGKYVARLLNP